MMGFMIYISDDQGEWKQLIHLPERSERWIKDKIRPLCKGMGEIHIYSALFNSDENEDYGLGDRIELYDLDYHYSYKNGRMVCQ